VNALTEKLAERIARDGPMNIEAYMAACLTDPDHGYYTTRDPFGGSGDFVTAPEISQMFGELIGLWCLSLWLAAGSPHQARLVELGPGRGTLMADALRAVESAMRGNCPFELHLVETSPTLRAIQEEVLGGRRVTWHDRIGGVPEGAPLLVIANEFFDALPIRQFVATPVGWRERVLDHAKGALISQLQDEAEKSGLTAHLPNGRTGQVAEVSPVRCSVAADLAAMVQRNGGAALIVDFSDPNLPLADTFQAVRAHAYADRFTQPGAADLASAVDFSALGDCARAAGARVHGPVGQGSFLLALGIEQRTEILTRQASPDVRQTIETARDRLVSPDGMGNDFRAMSLISSNWPEPEGFAPSAA